MYYNRLCLLGANCHLERQGFWKIMVGWTTPKNCLVDSIPIRAEQSEIRNGGLRVKGRKMVTITAIWLIAAFLFTSGFTFISLKSATVGSTDSKNLLLPLTDIKGHWAEAGIMEMYARGVMIGYRDGSFRPKKQLTYLDGIVMLDKMLWGEPPKSDFETSGYLKDEFKIPEWAVGYIASALRHQIIYYSDLQKVAQAQPLTRQEIAVFIIRALELTGKTDAEKELRLPFNDAKEIPDQLKGYVSLVNELGIMTGFPNGDFKGNRTVSRAEMAKILNNIADFVSYLKMDEVSGFIKSLANSEGAITLTTSSGKEVRIVLSDKYFIYLDNKAATTEKLKPGMYLRVITSTSRRTTVLLAQRVNPDEGTPVMFEQVLTLPSADILNWVEENKVKESYSVKTIEEKLYLLAARGEKMTGGYKITIRKIFAARNKNGGLDYTVFVLRSDPGRDSIVNQVISYPYSLVRFDKSGETVNSIIFLDELNRVLEEIKL